MLCSHNVLVCAPVGTHSMWDCRLVVSILWFRLEYLGPSLACLSTVFQSEDILHIFLVGFFFFSTLKQSEFKLIHSKQKLFCCWIVRKLQERSGYLDIFTLQNLHLLSKNWWIPNQLKIKHWKIEKCWIFLLWLFLGDGLFWFLLF